MPTGSVRYCTAAFIDNDNRNSSHAFTNAMMPAVKTPGAARGNTTRNKLPSRVQPSIIAAFSISFGMSWKKLTSINVQIGRFNTVYGSTSAQ